MHRWLCAVGLACAALLFGCARRDAKPARETSVGKAGNEAREPKCFEVVATDNSSGTRSVFTARHCQGGGVTWAAILRTLVDRHGASRAVEEPGPDWTGEVRSLTFEGHATRMAIDDEANVSLFCSDSERLVDAIRSDVKRLNSDPVELERAMKEADPAALECFPAQPSKP